MLADLAELLKRMRWVPERDGFRKLKQCSRCRRWHELRAFAINPSRGYKTWCRECEGNEKRDKYNSRRRR